MTNHFICRILVFDEEEFHTDESLKERLEALMDTLVAGGTGLLWEEVHVKQVEKEEYEKED